MSLRSPDSNFTIGRVKAPSVDRTIVALPDEDGREIAVDISPADVARVCAACFDHATIDVVEEGGKWRLAR